MSGEFIYRLMNPYFDPIGLALYAGLILLVSVGIMLTPVFHRLMHRFHLEEQDEADTGDRPRKHSKPGIG